MGFVQVENSKFVLKLIDLIHGGRHVGFAIIM